MANEKQSTQPDNKEKAVVKKPVKVTVSQTIRDLGKSNSTDRLELAKKVVANLKGRGITKNIKGHVITEANVVNEIGAMLRDIVNEKKGWWMTYTFEEDDKKLRIFLKAK
jgi:hypothetical protein